MAGWRLRRWWKRRKCNALLCWTRNAAPTGGVFADQGCELQLAGSSVYCQDFRIINGDFLHTGGIDFIMVGPNFFWGSIACWKSWRCKFTSLDWSNFLTLWILSHWNQMVSSPWSQGEESCVSVGAKGLWFPGVNVSTRMRYSTCMVTLESSSSHHPFVRPSLIFLSE